MSVTHDTQLSVTVYINFMLCSIDCHGLITVLVIPICCCSDECRSAECLGALSLAVLFFFWIILLARKA